MKLLLFISLPLYVLDQCTKWQVLQRISPEDPRVVIPDWFALVHVTNNGAAFGSFKGNNVFFVVLGCVAFVLVAGLLIARKTWRPWRDISLALLLAGIAGNLTDRFLYGSVIDFLLFDLHVPFAHPWPAFNVADSCICIAVFCFVIHSFWQKPEEDAVVPEQKPLG